MLNLASKSHELKLNNFDFIYFLSQALTLPYCQNN